MQVKLFNVLSRFIHNLIQTTKVVTKCIVGELGVGASLQLRNLEDEDANFGVIYLVLARLELETAFRRRGE